MSLSVTAMLAAIASEIGKLSLRLIRFAFLRIYPFSRTPHYYAHAILIVVAANLPAAAECKCIEIFFVVSLSIMTSTHCIPYRHVVSKVQHSINVFCICIPPRVCGESSCSFVQTISYQIPLSNAFCTCLSLDRSLLLLQKVGGFGPVVV